MDLFIEIPLIISILDNDRLNENFHKFINKINGEVGLLVSRPQITSDSYSFSIFINFNFIS